LNGVLGAWWIFLRGGYQEPAFDELRTKQQLGYVVFGYTTQASTSGVHSQPSLSPHWSDAVKYINVIVQGAAHTARDVEQRISTFMVCGGSLKRA